MPAKNSLQWPIYNNNSVEKTGLSFNTSTNAAPQLLKKIPPFFPNLGSCSISPGIFVLKDVHL